MEPADVVGFACVCADGGVRRDLVFVDGTRVPEQELDEPFVAEAARLLPHLDRELRANQLAEALAQKLRLVLRRQEVNIENVRQRADAENVRLRSILFESALEEDATLTNATVRKLSELRLENAALRDAAKFRDAIDRASVGALQAAVMRLSGALWALAPVSTALAKHQDPAVRDAYTTNVSLVNAMLEICEDALEACDTLLPAEEEE